MRKHLLSFLFGCLGLCAGLKITAAADTRNPGRQSGAQQFIFVGGEVRVAGRVPWTNGLMLTHCIERAGGFSDTADRRKLEIRSSGSITQFCDYNLASSVPAKNLKMSPGDVVIVPRDKFGDNVAEAAARIGLNPNLPPPGAAERYIYVEGEVRRTTRLPWTNDLRLSVAVEAAGGLTAAADPTRVQIRHSNAGMDTANYFEATNSPSKNKYLIRGDRIIVPRKEQAK